MNEYAFLNLHGEVLNIVVSVRSLEELQELYPHYEVKPLGQVTLGALRRYRYWSERP